MAEIDTTAVVGPEGEIRARVPEGETGGILLDLSPPAFTA